MAPDDSTAETDEEKERVVASSEALRKEGNTCLGLGVGVGTAGALGAAISGAVCPICIVVTPLLVGVGIVQRVRARKKRGEGSGHG